MNNTGYLSKIIEEFHKWYVSNIHSENINYYKDVITKKHLESLSKKDFIDFFYYFVYDGGNDTKFGTERNKQI